MTDLLLYIIIPATDAICCYAVYQYLSWKNNQMLKKMHPDEKNGLNLNISYKIGGNEVFGVHTAGIDLSDMIDNATRWMGELNKKKETIIAENRASESNVKS